MANNAVIVKPNGVEILLVSQVNNKYAMDLEGNKLYHLDHILHSRSLEQQGVFRVVIPVVRGQNKQQKIVALRSKRPNAKQQNWLQVKHVTVVDFCSIGEYFNKQSTRSFRQRMASWTSCKLVLPAKIKEGQVYVRASYDLSKDGVISAKAINLDAPYVQEGGLPIL